jgi:hypothetical protein
VLLAAWQQMMHLRVIDAVKAQKYKSTFVEMRWTMLVNSPLVPRSVDKLDILIAIYRDLYEVIALI